MKLDRNTWAKSGDTATIIADRQAFDMYANFIHSVMPDFKNTHDRAFVLNTNNITMLFYWRSAINENINIANLYDEQLNFLADFDKFLVEVSCIGKQAKGNQPISSMDRLNTLPDETKNMLIKDLESRMKECRDEHNTILNSVSDQRGKDLEERIRTTSVLESSYETLIDYLHEKFSMGLNK